jgi:hypothetical protein
VEKARNKRRRKMTIAFKTPITKSDFSHTDNMTEKMTRQIVFTRKLMRRWTGDGS